jgi:hypothetical protein
MIVVLVGVGIGILLSFGPHATANVKVSAFADSLVETFSQTLLSISERIPGSENHPETVLLFSTILALTSTGLLALLLTVAARALVSFRRALSFVLAVVTVGSFFFLPASSSVILVVFSAAVIFFLLIPSTFISSTALWALATFLAVSQVISIWNGNSPTVEAAAEVFSSLSEWLSPQAWKVVASAVAVVPAVAALLASVSAVDRN